MAITIRLYSVAKKHNSTAQPSTGNDFNCTLKEDCSIINPSVLVDLGTSAVPSYNYARIESFNRYYYVDSWTYEHGLWRAQLSVDVLATYKSAIGSSEQYILRSASSYNLNVADSLYPMRADEIVSTSSDSVWVTSHDSGRYVIGVVNTGDTGTRVGALSYYSVESSYMTALMQGLVSGITDLDSILKSTLQPLQYIKTCKYIPLSGISDSGHVIIHLGNLPMTTGTSNVYGQELKARKVSTTFTLNIPEHQQVARGKYLNLSPYLSHTLYLQPFGMIELDPAWFNPGNTSHYDTLYGTIEVDLITGECLLSLAVSEGGTAIYTQSANCAMDVALAAITSGDMAALGRTVSSGVSTAMAAATGNAAGAVVGGLGFIGDTASMLMPHAQTVGANGSCILIGHGATLLTRSKLIVDEDLAHKGRPLCAVTKISDLSGYLITSNASVTASGATSEEINLINNALDGGIYYE